MGIGSLNFVVAFVGFDFGGSWTGFKETILESYQAKGYDASVAKNDFNFEDRDGMFHRAGFHPEPNMTQHILI